MTTRDLFGLAVRLLGLFSLWTSANLVLGMVLGNMPFMFFVTVWQVFLFLVGLWMLRGASQLVDYAYPKSSMGFRSAASAPAPDDAPPSADQD